MKICYENSELEKLATDARYKANFAPAIVKAFRRRVQQIEAATDERDFYALKSLHYEKLEGKRKHQRSMRLNQKMRLILVVESSSPKNIVHIINIKNYH